MKVAVVTFPGSNCDDDAVRALSRLGATVQRVWHRETDLGDAGAVVLPGGFSYGDYLRAGALAAHSPVMTAVRRLAADGGAVLGICNGFQMLTEAGLLPGALTMNLSRRFQCEWVTVRLEWAPPGFAADTGMLFRLPIAHHEGRYVPDSGAPLDAGGSRVLLRYVTEDGRVTEDANPNGSWGNVAGVANAAGNVMGLMPHPERASASWLGGEDGLRWLEAWLAMSVVRL